MTQNTTLDSSETDNSITDFLIRIQWSETEKETISLDSSAKIGDVLHTFDVLTGFSRPDEYTAYVKKYESNGDKHVLELEYKAEDNIFLIQRHGQQTCGISTIRWKTDEPEKVEAYWCPTDVEYQHRYKGSALGAKLVLRKSPKELEYVVVSRLKRDQGRFRAELLKKTVVCEITGESELRALEAAHILPVHQGGNFEAENGLLLRADIHTLFDRGLLHIAGDGTVKLNEDFLHEESNYLTEANTKGWKLTIETLQRVGLNLVARVDIPKS
jgi:predicted acetyltransferase